MQIYNNKYVKIDLDTDKKLMYVKRLNINTNKEYKAHVKIAAEMISKYKPEFIIADNKEFVFPIEPKLQDWSVKILTPLVIKEKVKKIIYIESPDFIASLALEQIIEESKAFGFEINYVSSLEDAYDLIDK